MAVKVVFQDLGHAYNKETPVRTFYEGLSTDIKPTDCKHGSEFTELNTMKKYGFDGTSWWIKRDGSNVIINGVDSDGHIIPTIVNHGGYQVPIDYQHNLVHEEKIFTISHTFLSVAINGKVSIMLKADGLPLHIPDFTITSDVKIRLKSYLNPTVTPATGTAYTPFNRYTASVVPFGGTIRLSPTFTGGNLRGNDFMGANAGQGGSAVRAGGNRSGGVETLIASNHTLIYEFENVGSATTDINIIVNLYENQISVG